MAEARKTLTVIVPVRLDDAGGRTIERLDFLGEDSSRSDYAKVLVVDDGSPEPLAGRLRARCVVLGFDYVRLDTEQKVFSIGRCRNEGARRALSRYIFFQDLDLIPPEGFYEKLVHEIEIVGLPGHANNMIMIPVAYLTEAGTKSYLSDRSSDKFQRYLDRAIHRDERIFEKISTGTSACLYDRYYYLACGGNRMVYSGWGFEDIEFNARVVLDSGRYPEPAGWLEDISSFDRQTSYYGWKSAYRLFGDRSFLKGLLLFHAWHPIVSETGYRRRKENNRKYFLEHMHCFHKTGEHPEPLPSLERGKTLLFRKNAFTFARELQPLLGEAVLEDEKSFLSSKALTSFFERGSFDRILFHNPYATAEMQRVYGWAREAGLPFFVAERGALNNSVLFDPTGFLADSTQFSEEHWNRPLSADEEERVLDFIRAQRINGALLEEQVGGRMAATELRRKLNLTSADKVVLVCLQRPRDTATRFFEGELGSYQNFVDALTRLSRELPVSYRVLVKVHPLENELPDILGADVSGFHLYDLLSIADRLLTYNSGTGVQAMMWDLPVITCGRAFYDHESLTRHVGSYDELRSAATKDLTVDGVARKRFLLYLIDKYYSFGTFTTRQTCMKNGDRMTATTRITYRTLRFDGIEMRFVRNGEAIDDWQSMLFDRYLCAEQERGRPINKKKVKRLRFNLAERIYKASRNVPVAEPLIDSLVPAYEWLERRRK